MPTLIVKGLAGEWPPLADATTARDYVYVDDVVDAFLMAAASRQAEPGAVYNVGTGVQTTLQDVVALAARVLGINAEPRWGTMPSRSWDSGIWIADIHAIGESLGWRPGWTVEQGFRTFVEWFAQHPELRRVYDARRASLAVRSES